MNTLSLQKLTFGPSWAFLLLLAAVLTWPGAASAVKPQDVDGKQQVSPPPTVDEKTWPLFRGGPAMLGVAPGKMSHELALAWQYKTDGPVKSSAVIGDGRVFVGSDDGFIHAIDLKTGKGLWKFDTKDIVEAAPSLIDGKLYVGSSAGELFCLDAATGKPLWDKPYLTDDKILGAANWTLTPDGRLLVIVGSYDNFLHAVDAKTGQGVWKYETENFINGAPAIAKGTTVFGGCDGILHIVAVADGAKVGEVSLESYIAGSTAFTGDRAYLGHYGNKFICADVKTKKVVWEYGKRNFPFFSAPALYGGKVVFGGRDRRVHCVDAKTGAGLWEFRTRGKVDSSPVIIDGKIIVGSEDGRLYMLKLEDGQELWSFEVGQAIVASPGVAEGTVVVGAEDGFVYAFRGKP